MEACRKKVNRQTLRGWLDWGKRRLASVPGGQTDPAFEAAWIMEWASGIPRACFFSDRPLSQEAGQLFRSAIERRAACEPLHYILGEKGFWTLDFSVNASTLIPREDSESLIELLLQLRPPAAYASRPLDILDLGTGTGCLLLAALSEYRQARGVGVDKVPEACALAMKNAERLGYSERTQFRLGDWLEPVTEKFDIVLSNPPYVDGHALAHLEVQVRHYEPASALSGGVDGLDAYRHLFPALKACLKKDGIFIVEVGYNQADAVRKLAEKSGWGFIASRRDLGGIERALAFMPRSA